MKKTKFTAQEILDSFNMEFSLEDNFEIYKGIMAYSMGLETITPEIDIKLDKAIEYYRENDNVCGIINEDVMDYAKNLVNPDEIDED